MKDKENFIKELVERVSGILGESAIVRATSLYENNDKSENALEITDTGSHGGSLVYIDSYYEDFCEGIELDMIAGYICRQYKRQVRSIASYADRHRCILNNFEKARDRIIFRLVSATMNEDSLKDVPYIRILDLALIFCVKLDTDEGHNMWTKITSSVMNSWGVRENDLLGAALRNTPALLPVSLKNMESVYLEMAEQNGYKREQARQLIKAALLGIERKPMYVLTNSPGTYGAAVILYPDVLKHFAEIIGENLVILPSSIHETILVPWDDEIDLKDLKDMVMEINRNEVKREEWLADNVYLYERDYDRIRSFEQKAIDGTEVFYLTELKTITKERVYDKAAV